MKITIEHKEIKVSFEEDLKQITGSTSYNDNVSRLTLLISSIFSDIKKLTIREGK